MYKKVNVPVQTKILNFFKGIGNAIAAFFVRLWHSIATFFKNIYTRFVHGGWRTKMTHLIMGSGHIALKRPAKGIIYLVTQIAYWVYMFIPSGGFYWLGKFRTLGTVAVEYYETCTAVPPTTVELCPPGFLTTQPRFLDDSMLILLYGVATLLVTVVFLVIYFMQIRGTYKAENTFNEAKEKHGRLFNDYIDERVDESTSFTKFVAPTEEDGTQDEEVMRKFINPLPTFKDELKSLLNERFHLTALFLPMVTMLIFTVLPLVFMILMAFTDYSGAKGPPNQLFQWVGLDTFKGLFSDRGSTNFGSALWSITQWTFIWAIAATVSNYVFGLILAMIINRKSIRLKKLWRTFFVISIAVPQFVTLLLMSQLLQKNGPLNGELIKLGLISQDNPILFLEDKNLARITVILVNIWVGVPYTMLITSGILMNIPTDLYESARIDGAGPVRQFTSITLPYMLFVTGPYLITQFIGNINNFNVIFFLTGGGPSSGEFGVYYGSTDILITWLYSLTVSGTNQYYAIGSALGIFIFIISITITLVLYSRTSAAKSEGEFA